MVMRRLFETVEGEDFRFLGIGVARRARQVGQHVDRKPAVAVERAHLQAETDVARLEHIGAAVMLDRAPPIDEGFAGGRFHRVEFFGDQRHIEFVGYTRKAGGAQHLRQVGAHLADAPADRVAVDDGVHPAESVHALGRVDVAALDVEAVEA